MAAASSNDTFAGFVTSRSALARTSSAHVPMPTPKTSSPGRRSVTSEPTASISLISPDNYREFIAPYHKELVDYFKAKKVGVTTHICGVTYPIFEDLIGCGFTTVSFDLDQQSDPTLHVDQLERFMQVAKGRAVAIGNVDATMFEKATHAQIEAEVRRCIDTAARHSGFILSTSCEIPPRSYPEIVKWLRYPSWPYECVTAVTW